MLRQLWYSCIIPVIKVINKITYIKLLNICLVSSDDLEFANEMNAQYTAAHAAHLS